MKTHEFGTLPFVVRAQSQKNPTIRALSPQHELRGRGRRGDPPHDSYLRNNHPNRELQSHLDFRVHIRVMALSCGCDVPRAAPTLSSYHPMPLAAICSGQQLPTASAVTNSSTFGGVIVYS